MANHKYHTNGRFPVTMTVSTKTGCSMSITTYFNVYMTGLDFITPSSISFSVYPNPSSGNFTIDYSLNEKARIKVLLFDMTGRQVSELINKDQTSGNYTYHSNDLNILHGTYILKIYKDNNPAGGKLIVVQP